MKAKNDQGSNPVEALENLLLEVDSQRQVEHTR